MLHPVKVNATIAGLGITAVGKIYDPSATDFAAEAVRRAVADAGLPLSCIDGLLVSSGLKRDLTISLANVLGLSDLRLLTEMQAFGASAGAMISYAASAVSSGAAETVACVYADAPLKPKKTAGASYTGRSPKPITGINSYLFGSGITNPNVFYALAARRHMETYGTMNRPRFDAAAV